MPHIPARITIEAHDNASDHAGVGANRILPSLIGIWRHRRPGEPQFTLPSIVHDVEVLPIENLKSHQVQMDGMGIVRSIDNAGTALNFDSPLGLVATG